MDEATAEKLIERILDEFPTGEIGDGKIFTYDVDNAIRIRTKESGIDAL